MRGSAARTTDDDAGAWEFLIALLCIFAAAVLYVAMMEAFTSSLIE